MRSRGANTYRVLLLLVTMGVSWVVVARGAERSAEGIVHQGSFSCVYGWGNVVFIAGTTYGAIGSATDGAPVTEADLGPALGTVGATIGDLDPCRYDLREGDASSLAVGTPVYTLRSHRPTFRVAARAANGELILYQASWSEVARTGEDLLDIRGRVARMTHLQAGYCTDDICVDSVPIETTDHAAIDAAVSALLDAPVDPDRRMTEYGEYVEHAPSLYYVSFELDDGTGAGIAAFRDLGQTGNGIILPAGFETRTMGG